ncbi:hypothetical protein AB0P21_36315 [Kribbella sp. NPDC056861]|uniref:hypothetical protein n=1 Tax=Kribbella sp. NPDC056861 TaxID=3154857 RepID=UPI0034311A83
MDFNGFNIEYQAVRARLRSETSPDVESAQQYLRELAAGLPAGNDQQVASRLIDGLPVAILPPPPPSRDMLEARELLNEADFSRGTTQERVAEIDRVRKKIWAIADRGATDSAAIRGLTRSLDRTEEDLVEGFPWDDPTPDQPAGT